MQIHVLQFYSHSIAVLLNLIAPSNLLHPWNFTFFVCLWKALSSSLTVYILFFSFPTNRKHNSLYSKGRVLGYERAKRNQNPNVSLIQIEGCQTTKDAQFYLGKRVAYVYRAQREVNGSKIRVIWGRIARAHGTSGVVKARFRKNLPPKTFGASVRVMLYPSNI